MSKQIKFVGEVGCNHLGSMALAKEHIDIFADFAKVKYIKFQKRTISDLLTPEEYNAPHPNPEYAHGATYGQHREALEFSMDQHQELFDYCKYKNVIYSCSVWDFNSAKDLIVHLPDLEYIKIPSASNLNFRMMKYIVENSNCDLHISLGMTTYKEIQEIEEFVFEHHIQNRVVVYACTSGYPVEYKDLSLLEISNLKSKYKNLFKGVGFSGHHLGIAMDIAAATLGATWIERHIVTCRSTIRHTDAPASLEPDGARRLVRDLSNLESALTYKINRTNNTLGDLLEVEKVQRAKLKRNV